jgi:hypothetical protein
MQLTQKEQHFLEKRATFVRIWPLVGTVLLCLLIGLGVWLLLFRPLMFNPLIVLSELKNNSIQESTLFLLAGLLPITVVMCLELTLVIIIFGFVAFSNEKKHIAVIRRLIDSSCEGKLTGTEGSKSVKENPAAGSGQQNQ